MVDEFDPAKAPTDDPHKRLRHRTIKQVHADIERMAFNTAIARLMEYVNELTASGPTAEDLDVLVKLLAPYAPHLADELWERLGKSGFMLEQQWPVYDEALTAAEELTIVVQVNGKLRGNFTVAPGVSEEQMRSTALGVDKVKPHLEGKTVRKVIVVPGKLVNIVVG